MLWSIYHAQSRVLSWIAGAETHIRRFCAVLVQMHLTLWFLVRFPEKCSQNHRWVLFFKVSLFCWKSEHVCTSCIDLYVFAWSIRWKIALPGFHACRGQKNLVQKYTVAQIDQGVRESWSESWILPLAWVRSDKFCAKVRYCAFCAHFSPFSGPFWPGPLDTLWEFIVWVQVFRQHKLSQKVTRGMTSDDASTIDGFDHINRNAPVLIRTPKLTRFEPAQYWGGGPPGNSVVLTRKNNFELGAARTRDWIFCTAWALSKMRKKLAWAGHDRIFWKIEKFQFLDFLFFFWWGPNILRVGKNVIWNE